MKLYDTGVYLLNGQKIVPENQADFPVSKEKAAKSTIAYSILKAHNTSGNMEKLQIKFDKLTSHDITFVGIIPIQYFHRPLFCIFYQIRKIIKPD